jgi:hypothetical protein
MYDVRLPVFTHTHTPSLPRTRALSHAHAHTPTHNVYIFLQVFKMVRLFKRLSKLRILINSLISSIIPVLYRQERLRRALLGLAGLPSRALLGLAGLPGRALLGLAGLPGRALWRLAGLPGRALLGLAGLPGRALLLMLSHLLHHPRAFTTILLETITASSSSGSYPPSMRSSPRSSGTSSTTRTSAPLSARCFPSTKCAQVIRSLPCAI